MRGIQSDTKILIATISIIALVVVVALLVARAPEIPLSVRSSSESGAMALQMWVAQSGYKVQELTSLSQLEDLDVLFVLVPVLGYNEEDALLLHNWVRRGHTLIVAGRPEDVYNLLKPYDLSLIPILYNRPTAVPSSPVLHSPPFGAVKADALAWILHDDPEQQPFPVFHLYAGEQPILASLQVDRGQIWVAGALQPFTNKGLRDPGSAGFIANIAAYFPRAAVIGFDEISHGFGSASEQSLFGWLTATSPGWGIIVGLVLTMTFLALRGRRFGRALPLPDERLRRESAEYIHAIAMLFRRSGDRSEVLKHYDHRLRRALSDRYGIDPRTSATELVQTVVYHDPAIDEAALRHLFASLARKSVTEQELAKIVSELDHFLRNSN